MCIVTGIKAIILKLFWMKYLEMKTLEMRLYGAIQVIQEKLGDIMNLAELARIRNGRTARLSSWDVSGRNADRWVIPPGKSAVLADIKGQGIITHIWMTQGNHYRTVLLKITWDDAEFPSVLCPLGDFFGLGHGMVNSYQSLLFTASTHNNNQREKGCALNCYAPMPFKKRALIELINESNEDHYQYFYVDYENVSEKENEGMGYFHAEFRRTNPFGGWASEITVNTAEADAVNKEMIAWENNYVILYAKGKGHFIGCNLSVTNFQGTWWGEGDDMIWVDGYKWPPDLHGTGSEDFLNQAWGMQANAFLRNGSSLFEGNNIKGNLWSGEDGGYQTSYIHYIENPVRFTKEIKVTIEHGHGNHLANEMSSTAYWYAEEPAKIIPPPPVEKRLPIHKINGLWVDDDRNVLYPGKQATVTDEMKELKERWKKTGKTLKSNFGALRFVTKWKVSKLQSPKNISQVKCVKLDDKLDWKTVEIGILNSDPFMLNLHNIAGKNDGIIYFGNKYEVKESGEWVINLGHDGPAKLFIDGKMKASSAKRVNPVPCARSKTRVSLSKGIHEIIVAFDTDNGNGWGAYLSFEVPEKKRNEKTLFRFPVVVDT